MAKIIEEKDEKRVLFLHSAQMKDGKMVTLQAKIPLGKEYLEGLRSLDALLEQCHNEILEETEQYERSVSAPAVEEAPELSESERTHAERMDQNHDAA